MPVAYCPLSIETWAKHLQLNEFTSMALSSIKKYLAFLPGFLLRLCVSAQTNNSATVSYSEVDSTVSSASKQYSSNSFLRNLVMGSNYRSEWQQDVKLPVFRLSQTNFKIKELGGGMQTKSLHLVDTKGKEWALRTMNKVVTDAALTPAMRNRIGRELSQDLISTAFPYAAPLAGQLAKAAGITAARPAVFYVADDAALGPYREIFSGVLCTLEERDPGFDSTIGSEALLKHIRGKSSNQVQQQVYLRARLLDMLIADWDRHANNWRWGAKDSAGFRFYYAVPRDRDWAFFKSKGVVPWLIKKTGTVRCLVPFNQKLKNVKMQSWKSWEMDRELMASLNASEWEKAIASFCASLTDDAIVNAVKILPASIYATDGEAFVQKLKSRRDAMPAEVMKYYRFLVEDVVINGSDEDETFAVAMVNDSLKVSVTQTATQRLLYERVFLANETSSITLNGFGGNDVFELKESVKSTIRFIVDGGEGRDSYSLKGDVRCRINDAAADNNNVIYQGKAKLNLK